MLVLTRETNQSIIIDGDIKVTIISVGRGQVKIGIEAPKDVTVNREEIEQAKIKSGNI